MNKYFDLILINLIFLIIGIFLSLIMTDKRIEILGAVIATGISLSLGVRQYRTEDDKLFKELFMHFNQRYDNEFNDFLKSLVDSYQTNQEIILDIDQESKIVDYLNFCAEEYLWKTRQRIPDKVWRSWESGMIYYFSNPLLYDIFIKEKEQEDSYYGLYELIDKKIKNNTKGDKKIHKF